jgi:3-hydroxyisobutyrate dehydrogenase
MFMMAMNNKVIINDVPYSLEEIERECWRLIYHGALSSKNPMHYMNVATHSADGIGLRTVVLRKADPDLRIIRFHTDARSVKFREMQANPGVSLLLYDNPEKTQLRMTGFATLHTHDPIAEDCWQKTVLYSRRCYLSTSPPSTITPVPSSGLPEHFQDSMPTEEESLAGRDNFAVVQVKVHALDWLNLNAHGHRRARFRYGADGTLVEKHWLIP